MPERKRDAGTKSTKYAKTAHQDDMSLRCAIPFKMSTSLPADDNRRYYSKFPRIRASNAIGGFIKTALPTAVASRTTSHHSLHTHSTHGNDSKNRKKSELRLYRGNHALDASLYLRDGVARNVELGGDLAYRTLLKHICAINRF